MRYYRQVYLIASLNLSMTTTHNRRDFMLAGLIFLLALLVYTAALAPDVLYGDSAEFQTLAYTGGMTHPTGYPLYLLLARLFGAVPLNTFAWRINWFSAWGGAFGLAGVYLLARFFTMRGGALIASGVLLVSYTFWIQSIIAEVYTPAVALLVGVVLLLLRWQQTRQRRLLFMAALLAGLGLGTHLFFISTIGPAAVMFVLLNARRRTLVWAVLGTGIGLGIILLLFLWMDAQPTLTSFTNTVLYPSQDAWGRPATHLDEPLERIWFSISGQQWQDRMLPAGFDLADAWRTFFLDFLPRELTPPAQILALLGMAVALRRSWRRTLLLVLTLVTGFVMALIYDPGDKFIFFLPVYVLMAVFAGIGAGQVTRWLPSRWPEPIRVMLLFVLLAMMIGPVIDSRWQAVVTGRSLFSEEPYVYPVDDLNEPRRVAACVLSQATEPDAYLVLQWRALYSVYYVAHVERGLTNLHIAEARPYGTTGLTESLQADIADHLARGRAVYADDRYPELQRRFRLTPVRATCRDYPLFRLESQN